MARKLRIQYPGAIYHVMNRGDHQERIFGDDDDRQMFLATLAEGCEKTGWQIHSYCLMANHLHLVIETPNANLVEGMKWLLGVYTARFNRRHKVFGHLFSGRYKALIVDGSGNGYLQSVGDYVHLNPVRAGLLKPEQPLEQRGKWHYGAELSESAAAKAERLITEALGVGGITQAQLASWRKGHPFKVDLAAKLRAETTVGVSWIAQRLAMGTRGHLAHLLYLKGQTPAEPQQSNQPGLNI